MEDEIKKLKFEPGAMSIIQMGEELIGHPSTAISELVKNGYDADADKLWVYTQYHQNKDRNFLILHDNGLGMDYKTLFGDWLRPSISSKRDEDKLKRRSLIYNRRYLGSKGIGRLAAMALGKYLTVITKKEKDTKYNWLRIDRDSFRVDSLLEKVEFLGGTIEDYVRLFNEEKYLKEYGLKNNGLLINVLKNTPFDSFLEGTMIIIQDLDDSIRVSIEEEFTKGDINIDETTIFKSLRDLITPLKLNQKIQEDLVNNEIIKKELKLDDGTGTFELLYGINFIKDSVKGKKEFIPIEPSDIIKHYDYRVFGKVDKESNVSGKYQWKRLEDEVRIKDLVLSSKEILSDEDLNKRNIEELDIPDKYKNSDVGEFYFDIRVYDLDADSKEGMKKIFKTKSSREATNSLKKYLGLKISKNGFGVKPYGESEEDWLGLGAKRVNKHIVSIGPNQIIGYVYLFSPQNEGLNEKTNREGFFENKAFVIFKKIITSILEETGKRRAKHRALHNLGRKINSRHSRPETEKFIQYILSSSTDKKLIAKTKDFIQETNTALDNMEDSLSFSQRLATLGTGIELVYHELSQPLTALGASKESIEINAKKVQDIKLREVLLDRVNKLTPSLDLLDSLRESLKPAIGRSVAKKFKPLDTFLKVCFLYEQNLENLEIIIETKKNTEEIEIKSLEYIFWVTFLNILNNAIYWLQFTDEKRIIIFEYEDSDTLIISNTGPKIPNEDIDIIFDYGITSKKDRNATGLGLAFTRSLLTSKDWSIWAENRTYGPAFFIKKDNKA